MSTTQPATATPGGQLTLPLGLRVPDVREDCDSHLASLLRDVYWFHEKGLKTSKNAKWAERYKLGARTIPALLERLKSLGLVEIRIEHGTDRYVTPKFAIDDVALRWSRFAGYAWRMLSSTARNLLKARRIKKATPIEKIEAPAKTASLAPQIAPSNHPKSHPHPYEGTERKRVMHSNTQSALDEAPRLTHAESAAVDSLIARGVEPFGARRIVERFGAGTASTIARLLAWREKMGRTYDTNVTAWATWFTGRFAEGKLELPAGFTNHVYPKSPSDLGVRPQRVVADPEAAEKFKAEHEAREAQEALQRRAEAAWEALPGVERDRRLQEALKEVLHELPVGVARRSIERAGIEHRTVQTLARGRFKDELKVEPE